MLSPHERAMILVGAMVLTCALAPGWARVDNSSHTERRIRQVTAVKQRHEKLLLGLPQVVGVGVGSSQTQRDELAILVYVKRALKRNELKAFPKTLEGVPVEIIVSGPIHALPSAQGK